jgi:hypothetical protein
MDGLNDIAEAITYILSEIAENPDDSLMDIANDAFIEYCIPLECDEEYRVKRQQRNTE